MVVRKDGALALPGGFVDEGEDSEVTAKREAKEEASVRLPSDVKPLVLYMRSCRYTNDG